MIRHPPYLLPEWMEGLSEDGVLVQCVVNYVDELVQKPRNTRVEVDVGYQRRQVLMEKQVDLMVKKCRVSATINSMDKLVHPSESSPALQGACKYGQTLLFPVPWMPQPTSPGSKL